MQNSYKKILLVDPDPEATEPMKDYLESHGFCCSSADSIRGGLDMLSNEKFDAVISELAFSDGKAFDLLSDGCPPVIVLSALHGDDEVVGALSAGCSDYVFKPCSPRVMAARLEARFAKNNAFEYFGLSLNVSLRQVKYHGIPVKHLFGV